TSRSRVLRTETGGEEEAVGLHSLGVGSGRLRRLVRVDGGFRHLFSSLFLSVLSGRAVETFASCLPSAGSVGTGTQGCLISATMASVSAVRSAMVTGRPSTSGRFCHGWGPGSGR